MSSKIIAAGRAVKNDELEIYAEVAYDEDYLTDESGEVEGYTVALHAKITPDDNEMPSDVLRYTDIATLVGASIVVPGVAGHGNVTLEAPVVVKSNKMKAYKHNNIVNIVSNIRYEY